MDSSYAASATSTCATISGRACSSAAAIDEIFGRATLSPNSQDPVAQRLLFLATKLQQFRQHSDQLGLCLADAPTASHSLQEVISRYLSAGGTALTVAEDQVKRILEPEDISRVDLGTVSKLEDVLVSYSRLFIFVMQLLSMPDPASQDAKLAHDGGLQLIADAEASAAIVMSGVNIFGGEAVEATGPALVNGTLDGTLDGAYDGPLDDEPPSAAPLRTRKSGFAKSLSSLTSSFKAVAASMRPRPEPLVSPLCQAASRGNVAQIRGLLAQGANINGRNEDGNTALICSVLARQPATVRFLLSSGGASPSVRDMRKRRPPLFHALSPAIDDLPIAEILLAHGASPADKNLVGQPFFVDLVLAERLEPVRLCLEHGADPNSRDLTGTSVLAHAATRGNLDLVRLLLRHGASPDDKDMLGNTLLLSSIRNDRLPATDKDVLVRMLLDAGARPDEPDSWGLTALAHAAAADNVDLMATLLRCGADPDRTVHGDSLLVNALDRAMWDQAALLVLHGRADTNRPDVRGRSPLTAALQRQNPDAVRLLLDHGAEPSRRPADAELVRVLLNGQDADADAISNPRASLSRPRGASPASLSPPRSSSPGASGTHTRRLQRRSRTGSRPPSIPPSQSPPPVYHA